MKNSLLKFFFAFVILVRVAISYVPVLQFGATTVVNMGTFFAIYAILAVSNEVKIYFQKTWKIGLLVLLGAVYSLMFSTGSLFEGIYGYFQLMIWPLSGLYMIDNYSKKELKHILYVMGIMFLITLYTTYTGCIKYPNAARMLASSKEENMEYELLYHSLNIGGFILVYTCVLFIPLLIYLFKYRITNRIVLIILYLSVLALIVTTEYTTALLIFALSSLMLLLPNGTVSIKRSYIIFIVIGGCFLIIFSKQISGLFSTLSSLFSSSEFISSRMTEISSALSGKKLDSDADLLQRNKAWTDSISMFFNSPIWGDGILNGGGHSYILDSAAQYGCFGIIAVYKVFKSQYELYIKPYTGTIVFIYAICLFVINFILCLINTNNSIFVICFILPLFFKIYSLQSTNNA